MTSALKRSIFCFEAEPGTGRAHFGKMFKLSRHFVSILGRSPNENPLQSSCHWHSLLPRLRKASESNKLEWVSWRWHNGANGVSDYAWASMLFRWISREQRLDKQKGATLAQSSAKDKCYNLVGQSRYIKRRWRRPRAAYPTFACGLSSRRSFEAF